MIKKIIICSLLTSAVAAFNANANDGGTVQFKGKVLDTPCGISADSLNQVIEFDTISNAHLDANGISQPKDVNIKLTNCIAGTKSVNASFTGGVAGVVQELGTTGNTNTAIVMASQDGTKVSFDGTPAGSMRLIDGDNTLHFSSWVKKADGAKNVTPGDFSAITNFVLNYF